MKHENTILIVDDNELGRESLGDLLAMEPVEIAFAADGEEGLRLAETLQPDLILLDVMMPGMDGYEVCQRLRADEKLREVPILLLTALDDRASRVRGIEAGADDFITKPYDRLELRTRVRTILRLNRYRKLRQELANREKAEEEREQLRAQYYQAQKMESIGRLAAGVAHDFNNMLTIILGFASLGTAKFPSDHAIQSDLKAIIRAVERSTEMTTQLLAFSRNQAVAPKVIDLNQTFDGLQKLIQRMVGGSIRLLWMPSAGLWPIMMDPSHVVQILLNLCVNAKDAIGEKGNITMVAENIDVEEESRQGDFILPPGQYVRISVSDDGSGIPKAILPMIFDPFFTTKEKGKGTGLGLATVHGIVHQCGGAISVVSDEGEGTTFHVFLPRHQGPSHQEQARIVEPLMSHANKRILLVDDEPEILHLTKLMLEESGFIVHATKSPNQAIEIAAQHSDSIDLVISNIVMPDMNGHELLGKLREINPSFRFLLISGHPGSGESSGPLEENMTPFLQKPYKSHQLLDKVQSILEVTPATQRV